MIRNERWRNDKVASRGGKVGKKLETGLEEGGEGNGARLETAAFEFSGDSTRGGSTRLAAARWRTTCDAAFDVRGRVFFWLAVL